MAADLRKVLKGFPFKILLKPVNSVRAQGFQIKSNLAPPGPKKNSDSNNRGT